MPSIKTDVLVDSVHNTFHYADMTGDMVLISKEMFSSRLYKSAERVRNSLLFKQSRTYKSQANRWGKRAGQEMLP